MNLNLLNSEDTLFLMIDIQEKLLNAVFNKDSVQKKSKIIAEVSRILNIPVLVSEQYPQGLGETIDDIKKALLTETKYFTKTTFNALEVLELAQELASYERKNIVLLGIETHICVYQTALALLREGYNVVVLTDACGSRVKDEYISALKVLQLKGVELKTTEMVIFEFLRGAKHPNFKEIQALVK